jgi:NPCBM/NEW2 domain-containing protein
VTSGLVRRARLSAAVTLAGLLAISAGCGQSPEQVPAPATSVATSSLPSPVPTDSATPGPSATGPSPGTEDPTGEPTGADPEESDKPPVLGEEASGRALTTADFFDTPDDWADGRFNVAGQKDLAGIGGPLSNCEDEASDSSPTIEIRLANNFTRLSMKVGQSDESPSSESEVNVKVLGNGKYLDTVRVPFNKIVNLEAPVTGVNALKLQVWMGGENCNGDDVEAVLMDLKVE